MVQISDAHLSDGQVRLLAKSGRRRKYHPAKKEILLSENDPFASAYDLALAPGASYDEERQLTYLLACLACGSTNNKSAS